MEPIPPLKNELDLTIFVACYNEEENIIPTLDTLIGALDELPWTWEIIIIDDASVDRSVEVINKYMAEHPNRAIRLKINEVNKGLAQNHIEGAFLGRGKYYRLVCGDNVEPRENFIEIFKHLGQADMIIPYLRESHGRTVFRKLLSKSFTKLINLISGYRFRYYNGCAVHLRYNVMRWHTNYHGFGFQADMITRLLDQGATYIEVPMASTERSTGASKAMTMKNFFSVTHTLLDISIRRIAKIMYKRT